MSTEPSFQEGIISDGDGKYLAGSQSCQWTIAPPGASNINLQFTFFDMSPDYIYNQVYIDICHDVACTESIAFPNSPFELLPGSSPILDIGSASTGFVRVRFPAKWSGHTQARFALYYSTDLNAKTGSSGINTGSWHHVSAVIESMNESSFSASVYINGTLFVGPFYSSQQNKSGLSFAGESGIAIGRSYPMSAPFGYFKGYIDELVVMDRIINLTSLMKTSCMNVAQTALCFSFDRATVTANGFRDLGTVPPANAVTVNQDRFLPWCITRNDGGELVLFNVQQEYPFGLSWGFCTDVAYLPGRGYDYDAETLYKQWGETFEGNTTDFNLKNIPGCSNIPLIIDGNTAGRYVLEFYAKERNL